MAFCLQAAREGSDLTGTTHPADGTIMLSDLIQACTNKNFTEARRLLEEGVNMNAVCSAGHTPLYRAVSCSNIEQAQLLLIYGANVNHASKLLLEHQADVNTVDNEGKMLLIWASVRHDEATMIQRLLERGVHVSATDHKGKTCLHWASESGKAAPAEHSLAQAAADVDAVDNMGMKPIFLATGPEVARLFLERKANVNAVDKAGRTPFQRFAELGKTDLAIYAGEWGKRGCCGRKGDDCLTFSGCTRQ